MIFTAFESSREFEFNASNNFILATIKNILSCILQSKIRQKCHLEIKSQRGWILRLIQKCLQCLDQIEFVHVLAIIRVFSILFSGLGVFDQEQNGTVCTAVIW